jgi:hypothetical protein
MTPAEAAQMLHDAIFALDVYYVILGCGSLLFNLNGRVPDEGAVAEATMAWMLGKPTVFFKADSRSLIEGRDNPIVAGQTRFQRIDRLEAIGPALDQALRQADIDPAAAVPCPPHLGETLQLGLQFCEQLERTGPKRRAEPAAEIVCDLFGRRRQQETAPSARVAGHVPPPGQSELS